MKMKLYLLTTAGLGDFYVIADNPSEAESHVLELLNKADYGFTSQRKICNIKVVAEEVGEFPKDKPNFSSGNNLILNTTFKNEKTV